MSKWCEIFRTGRHKDSKGNEKEWTRADLDKIKYNFENINPDVPICIGHPKTNAPAYGWWDKLKVEDNKLFAKFKQVQPEFMEACNKGLFKTRSISLTSDLVPRHLAFLGAQAPAIKGMEEFCFQEDESDIKIEFNSEVSGDNRNAYTDFEEENQDLKAQIQELQKQIKEKEEETELKEFEDFCDESLEKGKILPRQKTNLICLFKSLNDKTFDFEDGSNKSAKEVLKELILGLQQFDFQDIATNNNALVNKIDFNDPNAVKEAILSVQNEYKNKGIDLDPIEALRKVKER